MRIFNKKRKTESKFSIDYLGSSMFCLEGLTQSEVERLFQIDNARFKSAKESIKFLFPENNWDEKIDITQLRIIISPNCNGWIFVKCQLNEFKDIKNIISNLISKTDKKVNYYYVDSHIDYYSWILSNNGKIEREFLYSMGEVMNSKGLATCPIEQKFENKSERIFGEDVYEEVAKINGVSLYILNENLDEIGDFIIGTFNNNALQHYI
ncbi:hypothetical protein [Aquimarina algiphila]|uniref:hypothetical protein n=1 Tax=Aquimarina algiphila TaxID=2047982 RepID=UPI00232ACFA5|nr:hypothetical protein [Aquimarina algiphila]